MPGGVVGQLRPTPEIRGNEKISACTIATEVAVTAADDLESDALFATQWDNSLRIGLADGNQ